MKYKKIERARESEREETEWQCSENNCTVLIQMKVLSLMLKLTYKTADTKYGVKYLPVCVCVCVCVCVLITFI